MVLFSQLTPISEKEASVSKRIGSFKKGLTIVEEAVLANWVRKKWNEFPEIVPMNLEDGESVLEAADRYGVKVVLLPDLLFYPSEAATRFGMRYIALFNGNVRELEAVEGVTTSWVPKK